MLKYKSLDKLADCYRVTMSNCEGGYPGDTMAEA